MGSYESRQDEVSPVGAHGTGQGQQPPGEDEVDQQRTEASLSQSQEKAGGQGPHECGPGPQGDFAGHGSSGEPGSQGGEWNGQEHQSADEGTGPEPDEPTQRGRRGQNGQQRGDAPRVAVTGGDPGAPGGVPHLSPTAAEQGQSPAGDRAGEQQPGQAVGAQRQDQHDDGAQGPTSAAGQGSQLT